MKRWYRGRSRGRRRARVAASAPQAVSSEAMPLYRAIIESIERDGFAAIGMEPEGGQPGRVYTVGLIETYQHAELIVFGAMRASYQSAIQRLVGRLRQGHGVLPLNTPIAEVFDHLPGTLKTVAPEIGTPYVSIAQWRAQQQGLPLTLVQVVRPDPFGCFAWEPGFDHALDRCQLTLYDREPGRVIELDLRRGRASNASVWRP